MRINNMFSKVLKATVFLSIAATIPFVGWSYTYADEPTSTSWEETTTTVHSGNEHCCKKEFFERIKATPEQQTKLSKIFEDAKADKAPLKEQLRAQEHELHQLVASKDATDDQITSQFKKVQLLREGLMDKHLGTMLKVRAVLTPEQRGLMHPSKNMHGKCSSMHDKCSNMHKTKCSNMHDKHTTSSESKTSNN